MHKTPPERSVVESIVINFVAPLALLAVAGAAFLALGTVEPPKRPPADSSRAGRLEALPPIRVEPIRVLDTTTTPLFLSVDGTVVPFQEAVVAAELAGRVVEKSEQCESGNFVKKGDLLMQIDKEDYLLEVRRLTQQKDQEYQLLQELDQEMINSQRLIDVAEQDVEIQQREVQRQKDLPIGFSSQTEIDQANRALLGAKQQLVSQKNQLDLQRKRRARIEASERLAAIQLEVAEVNLRRTKIVAPIDGVIVSEQADVNTFVVRGSPLVTIEDTSKVEVSTSLRMDQLYWILDQNERFSERREPNLNAPHSDQAQLNYVLPQTEALIEYEISGRRGSIHRWQGNLMSYDGIGLDPKTRTVPVRVLVDHPTDFVDQYGNQNLTVGTPPLVRGMFVQVKLLIRPKTKLFVVPSKALQPGNRIYQFSPDESVLEPSNPEFGEPTQTQISESKPQTGQFKTNDWSPGRVSIRESVMPVDSLAIKDPAASNITSDPTLPNDKEFWVCEVAGLSEQHSLFVVTSPLGSVTQSGFAARALQIDNSKGTMDAVFQSPRESIMEGGTR